MPSARTRRKKDPPRIREERGRKVTQLDPIELSLLRRHDVIDQVALRAIVDDVGTGIEDRHRRLLPFLAIGVAAIVVILVVQIVEAALMGDPSAVLSPRNIALANIWVLILAIWTRAKQARFGRIRRIMLKHARCPHCGYDMHGLPREPSDGATLCPECGCAWRLGDRAGEGAIDRS